MVTICNNFIGGVELAPSTNEYMDVHNPANGEVIGKVGLSNTADVNIAVAKAREALKSWSSMTVKTRSKYMYKLHHLIEENSEELDPDLTNYICERAMEKGVFSICTGRGTIKIGPPLSIPDDALIEGLKVYEECFEELF